MELDHQTIFKLIQNHIERQTHPAKAINDVILACSNMIPSTDWNKIKAIDWNESYEYLYECISETVQQNNYTGDEFWFGLFNPVWGAGPTCGFYLGTGLKFDENNDDWPCGPEDRIYFEECHALDEMYQIAYETGKDKLNNDIEYPIALAYCVISIAHMDALFPKKVKAIAVGFDSGDFFYTRGGKNDFV